VRRLIDHAHGVAGDILTTYRAVLDNLASALIEKETLETEEVMAILAPVPKWEHPAGNGATPHNSYPQVGAAPAATPSAAATPRPPESR
jgi:cell division protease FtsH